MISLYLTLTIVGYLLLLILNIFYLYIPTVAIRNDVDELTSKVDRILEILEPLLIKVEPILESIIEPLL
jgi:hypothetical protein